MDPNMKMFNWPEYTVFFVMLSASALIGVFFALKARRKGGAGETTEDYMLGGRKMPYVPTALSLTVSFVSGITLLGFPAEVYTFGTQILGVGFSITACMILLNIFYLPVFYHLQYKSIFEYLERRFDKKIRCLASFIFAFSLLLIVPMVIYVPSLAFNQVTGVPISTLAPVVCTVCVFYTAIGGLKAVVWSDALQSLFTVGTILAVIVLGSRGVGGIQEVYRLSEEGERIELFNFDMDPTMRNTFWTTALGTIPIHLNNFAIHPGTIQRYISLPTYRKARLVSVGCWAGILLLKTFCGITGLIIYAKYRDCDPVITKQVSKPGQLLPYFVMDVAENYPGLAGLFLAGVVSTALSSMSTGLNTLAGTLFEDFIRPCLPRSIKDRKSNLILKIIVVLLGVLCTLMVYVVQKLGTIVQIAMNLEGITAGVSTFIFTFGMITKWGNSKGVLSGAIAGFITTSTLAIGSNLYAQTGDIVYGRKVTTIESCPLNMTLPLNLNTTRFGYPGEGTRVLFNERVPWIFRVSYLYYSLIGFLVSMAVGSLVSLATGPPDSTTIDPKLLIPQLRQPRCREHLPLDEYSKVPTSE